MKMFRGAAVAAAVAGSTFAFNAQAVNLATDGIGEVAIAPFYTVRDGWSTLINLTNTDARPMAVKVRFHESNNSRDVLDFTVLLSGYDVFTGIVTEDANGNAVFRSTDTPNAAGKYTCTIPTVLNKPNADGNLPNVQMSTAGFKGSVAGDNDKGVTTTDRLKEGYIEFIVMGHAQADAAPAGSTMTLVGLDSNADLTDDLVYDVGYAIEEHNCDANLDRAFSREPAAGGVANTDYEILNTARQFGEPINALKFNFRLINVARGVEAGNSATTWANFYNPLAGADGESVPADNFTCDTWRGVERHNSDVGVAVFRDSLAEADWDPAGGAGAVDGAPSAQSCMNLIAEQQRQAFLEPTLNDAFPVAANSWEDTLNDALSIVPTYASVAGPLRGIDAVSATIARRYVVNEWSTNSSAGVTTDWIVTQPTKAFYVDGTDEFKDAAGTMATGISTNESIQSALATERYEAQVDFDTDGVFEANTEYTGLGFVAGLDLPLAPYTNRWAVRAGQTIADACNEVGFRFFDRAEQTTSTPASGVIVSPQLPETVTTTSICHEATVVSFNGASAFNDAGSLAAQNRVDVDTSALSAQNGWMLLDLAPNGEGLPFVPVLGVDADGDLADDDTIFGLPVIGFNLKVRSLGDANAASNYASTLDHGFVRRTGN